MSSSHKPALARSIALIGLSGTGKSTVGRSLADLTGLPLLDTDTLIISAAGRSIEQIFREDGEGHFRQLEHQALRAALAHPAIIATGGGIVLLKENRALLREHAYIVWLDAPTEILAARLLAHDEARPLLAGDLIGKLTAHRNSREHLYTTLAQLRIDTYQRTAEQIREEILQALPDRSL